MKQRRVVPLLAIALIAAACSKGEPPTPGVSPAAGATTSGSMELSAQIASYDLFATSPQRVLLGLFSSDGLISYGSVPVTFSYMGTADQPEASPSGAFDSTAYFILVPEEAPSGQSVPANVALPSDETFAADQERAPELTEPTGAKGVYQASDVVFDKPGYWQAEATVTLKDGQTGSATAAFEVGKRPVYPAVGQAAPRTVNLTMSDIGPKVPIAAVDSRAVADGEVPDPDLHGVTIKDALAGGYPIVIVVSTPAFCQSRFCGPIAEEIGALQATYGDRAQFVHLEVWNDFQNKVINKGAAEWAYRNKEFTEPWVFLVGPDGKIMDRWANVLDPRELTAYLDNFPVKGV